MTIALAEEVGANGYIECSALSGKGMKDVFDAAIRTALEKNKKKKKKCIIL